MSDAPQVSLVLGRALKASNLKEGDDVYFDCLVKANPPPRRVVWKKEVVKHGKKEKQKQREIGR